MDDRLKQEVLVFARRLAVQEKNRLAKLGTFVEIEDLTAEIGDELTKQLAQNILSDRADEAAAAHHACPDCGKEAPPEEEREPLILQGKRGEIEYSEPVCYCTRCRVRFFPGGRRIGASGS
jgi:DNA repair exonuclease SbcCD ATPase subunit